MLFLRIQYVNSIAEIRSGDLEKQTLTVHSGDAKSLHTSLVGNFEPSYWYFVPVDFIVRLESTCLARKETRQGRFHLAWTTSTKPLTASWPRIRTIPSSLASTSTSWRACRPKSSWDCSRTSSGQSARSATLSWFLEWRRRSELGAGDKSMWWWSVWTVGGSRGLMLMIAMCCGWNRPEGVVEKTQYGQSCSADKSSQHGQLSAADKSEKKVWCKFYLWIP